jgi:hypothetical protein
VVVAGAVQGAAPVVDPDGNALAAAPDAGTSAALWVAAAGVLFIGIYPGPLLWAAQGAVRLIVGG